jgi:hypothetical protein
MKDKKISEFKKMLIWIMAYTAEIALEFGHSANPDPRGYEVYFSFDSQV